jgi:hypothetical protein
MIADSAGQRLMSCYSRRMPWILIGFVLLAACSSPGSVKRELASTTIVESRINGQSADSYYRKFIYKSVQIQPNHKTMWSYLGSNEFVQVDDGQLVNLSLFLQSDGTFTLRYIEGPPTNGGMESRDSKDIAGTWHIEDQTLVLGNQGSATGVQVGTIDVSGKNILVDGVSAVFKNDFISKGFAGKAVILVGILSTGPM